MLSTQFLKFLLVGGIAAVANFSSRMLFDIWFSYSASIVLAYSVGMCCAFLLNRLFVFETNRNLASSWGYFVLVNLVAVAQTWAIAMLLANFVLQRIGIHNYVPEIAHAVGVIVPVVTSYYGHKYFSFSPQERT